jgi:hypothetical protein
MNIDIVKPMPPKKLTPTPLISNLSLLEVDKFYFLSKTEY